MTIAPATLQEIIASSRIEPLRTAIVGELKRLIKGVTITNHPGKVDINDLLEKAIVPAPGIALGWSRIRAPRDVGETYTLPIEWSAFIVTEDYVDRKVTPARVVNRDIVAMAIGGQLLKILRDPETPYWGLAGITDPAPDPAPEMRPVLTMKTAAQGTVVYMVSWTQGIVLQGTSPFDGETPGAAALPDGMEFDLPDGELPPEILAVLGREKADAPAEDEAA